MAFGSRGKALRQLRAVLQQWPVDASRKGRDLGEFLRDVYPSRFKKTFEENVSFFNVISKHTHHHVILSA